MRQRAWIIFVVLLASFAYFYEGGGWNQNTRFDLVRAIVEHGTLRIDMYHENTGDKAQIGPHFYMDKAPGASLTAVPPVALVRGVLRAVRVNIRSRRVVIALSYVATLAASALPAALAGVCVFWLALWSGADARAGAVAAIVSGLGTPMWAYATLLYGHALAAGSLALALVGAVWLRDAIGARAVRRCALLTGCAAGWSVVTEYPASIPAGLIVLFALWQAAHRDERPDWTDAAVWMGVGLGAGAIVLLGYNWLAFGKPIYIGYTSEEGYAAMRTGIFGVNLPSISVLDDLLFGLYRGLLPLAPILAITPVGYYFLIRDQRTRAASIVAGAIVAYYFALTSGYAYWSGGWSYGSRHLAPALPFLCFGLVPLWQRGGRLLRGALLAVALVGAAESLIAVATTPQPPADVERPMLDLLWPAFQSGDFPIGWQSVLDLRPPAEPMSALEAQGVARGGWNLGQLAGLTGFPSLLPLAGIWIACGFWWVRGNNAQSAHGARPKEAPMSNLQR